MVSKRKAKSTNTHTAESANNTTETLLIDIPEDEQWRLINESGILSKARGVDLPPRPKEEDVLLDETAEPQSLCDEIFSATLLIIPFSFLLLLMEILIHQQYGQRPKFSALVDRMTSGIPVLSVFIFYTNRHKAKWPIQLLLFIIANVSGPRLIYLINTASWRVNMQQCPPLVTLWIYAILQLDLGRAILNLILVAIWVYWKGMKISF